MVYHQNIRDLLNKSEELISFLSPDIPQVLCLTEHHLRDTELDFMYTWIEKSGAKFCVESFKSGEISFICTILFGLQIFTL
jgi:hypothetical protein